MLKEYTYEEQESGRSDTLVKAIERIEKLEKQLEIAKEVIRAVLCDEFIMEHADAGLVMYLTQAEYKIKELEK
jgi:hypothetical protein